MDVITNGQIVERIKHDGIAGATKYLENIKKKCSTETLMKDLDRLFKKYQHLNKSKSRVKGKENFDRFTGKNYEFPVAVEFDSSCKSLQEKTISQNQLYLSSDDQSMKANMYQQVASDLAGELYELNQQKQSLEEELHIVINEKDDLNESLDRSEQSVCKHKKQLKRTSNREMYWREKCIKLDNNDQNNEYMAELMEQVETLKTENGLKMNDIKVLNDRVFELENENRELTQAVAELEQINVFDESSKTYTTELHECVYSLLNDHVPYERVSSVISNVLKLAGKKPNKLPSVGTIHNWSIERVLIARKQIAEKCENQNTTLHTDEASKYGQKWGAFATRDNDGNYYLLGLRDMATKSSQDTLDTFKDILKDIDEITSDGVGHKLLTNIKNTMSDRASTETKFNDLLQQYRLEILPEVINNYNELCAQEQLALSRMNNFFCGLHTLVHMADTAQKSLVETENIHFNNNIPGHSSSYSKPGQPGTTRLILTCCKAFARRGDQKNGCHGNFMTYISEYLKTLNINFPLQPLKGNRFNILFTNAGHIFFFHKKMVEFLKKLPAPNLLLQSVLYDLQEPFFLAGCKALGLISKFISTPLWHVIEKKDISISEMNVRYSILLNFLRLASDNVDDFVAGKLLLFDDVPIKKDKVFDFLLESVDLDCHVSVILLVMLPALAKLIERQYGDHLPGGVHEFVSEVETMSVDKHNKYPERVFSYVDHILSAKPNINTLTMEAHITFSLNKTGLWLAGKENSDEIIKQCRKEVHLEKNKFRQREELIKAKRLEKQNEEFRKKEIKEQKRIQKLEKETDDMTYYGLWQSENQMINALNKIDSDKEKEEALKVQLRFRKNVFEQKTTENVYVFSRCINGKRVPLTIEELKSNLMVLIRSAYSVPPPDEQHMLVGHIIDHKFLENGNTKWFKGKVISQVPGYEQWFNIIYEGDDDIYTSKLGDDYAAGDVVIKT